MHRPTIMSQVILARTGLEYQKELNNTFKNGLNGIFDQGVRKIFFSNKIAYPEKCASCGSAPIIVQFYHCS